MSLSRIKKLFFKKNDSNSSKGNTHTSGKEWGEELVKNGEQLANSNKFQEALQSFGKAIELDSSNDRAYGDMALILDKIGKHDEAIAALSKALSIDSKNPITWHNKGLMLVQQNKIHEAIECFENAIQNKEDYAKAWYNKGRCYDMLGNFEESQKCLNMSRKLDPFIFTRVRRK